MSAYYRSTDPEVLTAWEDSERRHKEIHASIGAFAKRFDCNPAIYSGSDYRIAYIVTDDGKDRRPEGPWRRRVGGGWVPHRGSKAGKALGKEWDALRATNLGDVPGMPKRANGGRGDHGALILCSYGILEHDGTVYVNWSCDEDAVENSEWGTFDGSKWQRIKASEYHLAKEAHDAEKVTA